MRENKSLYLMDGSMCFQKTIEKVGDLANDGMRVMEELRVARGQAPFQTETTSH